MRLGARLGLSSVFALAAASLAACSGLLGDFDTGAGPADGGGPDAPAADAPSADAPVVHADGGDAALDAPVSCISPQVSCNGACVDLSNNGANCGTCGHDCGGGGCSMGKCQPMVIAGNQPGIRGLAVDGTNVYWSSNDDTAGNHLALTCPVTGCVGAPKQLVSFGQYIAEMVAGNGLFVFVTSVIQPTDHPELAYCPETGCVGATPPVINGGTFSGFSFLDMQGDVVTYYNPDRGLLNATCAAGGTSCTTPNLLYGNKSLTALSAGLSAVAFIDQTGGGAALATCPRLQNCASPSVLVTSMPGVAKTVVANMKVWTLASGMQGGLPGGSIASCDLSGCGGTPTPFVTKQAYPTDLAIDASGVYWINSDDHAIKACPLSGCVGGPVTVAQNLTAPQLLRIDGKFVYYADGTSILRVAR